MKGPVYIRFGREAVPDFMPETIETEIGKGQILKDGKDISLIATGHMVWEALQASYILEKNGINARVINIHTIKPIDKEIIIRAAFETKRIVTVEEHQVYGGFGSAVAEVVSQNCPVKMKIIGINDTFGESGQPAELMKKFKLTSDDIYETVMKFLNENDSGGNENF